MSAYLGKLQKISLIYFFDVIFFVWSITWFFLPVSVSFINTKTFAYSALLYPFSMPGYVFDIYGNTIDVTLLFFVYIIPIYFFIKFIVFCLSFFNFSIHGIKKLIFLFNAKHFISAILRIVLSLFMLYVMILPFFYWADTPIWIQCLPIICRVCLIITGLFHVISVMALFYTVNSRNTAYVEYKKFIKEVQNIRKTKRTCRKQLRMNPFFVREKIFTLYRNIRKKEKIVPMTDLNVHRESELLPEISVATDESHQPISKGIRSAFEVLFKIRSKLFIAFIGVIIVSISLLSILILARYKTTIFQVVSDSASGNVIQAVANYRVNLGDPIAMTEYMTRLYQLNSNSAFSYNYLDIYTNLGKVHVYIDDVPETLPTFRLEYSTRKPGQQYPLFLFLSDEKAKKYIDTFLTSPAKVQQEIDVENRIIRFVFPIIVQSTVKNDAGERIRKNRLIGFSVLEYNQDIINKSYFKTKVAVCIFTIVFIYIAIILTYCVGNFIVNPLLFLRMNVRKISDLLAGMIAGNTKISLSTLVYQDYVQSHDEIKALSGEINDMVTVIRGIIPYISISTLKQADKGGPLTTRQELTFLFTDIRGFTALCEQMDPESVVSILNHYLNLETQIILENHGDIDKFVGDEIMAFFDGPDKELNACRAAMKIRAMMMEERENRLKKGDPIISIGIGINTGSVVFGSVGAQERMDFTSIGDTVNLAARLESANKTYKSKTIITEAVYEKLKNEFICRELDYIAVKGKVKPVRIYELLQERKIARKTIFEIKSLFEKALVFYRCKNWEKAEVLFLQCKDLYQDGPSEVFLDRITLFKNNPPPEKWDGVFRMSVK